MIALLTSRIRIEEKLLLEAFKKNKQEVVLLDSRKLILGKDRKDLDGITLALDREIAQVRGGLILGYFERHGITTINTSRSTRIANNKAVCTWELDLAGVLQPKSYVAFSHEEAKTAASILEYPVVLKPVIGSWGRLLAKVDNSETLEAILEHKDALSNSYHSLFYLQKYIEKPGRDIRVFIVGYEPIAAMYRYSDHWITNTAQGSVPKKCTLDNDLKKIAAKAAKTIGTEIAGIDVIETKTGYEIIEVNSTPEFHGLQEVTGFSIADSIVSYVNKRNASL